jgi:hypothetical protein
MVVDWNGEGRKKDHSRTVNLDENIVTSSMGQRNPLSSGYWAEWRLIKYRQFDRVSGGFLYSFTNVVPICLLLTLGPWERGPNLPLTRLYVKKVKFIMHMTPSSLETQIIVLKIIIFIDLKSDQRIEPG